MAERKANYDESRVPEYVLPPILICSDGTEVKDIKTWEEKRRPEILDLFCRYVYGYQPEIDISLEFDEFSRNEGKFDGKATMKQITINVLYKKKKYPLELLLFVPNNVVKPVGVFVGLNFQGNHTISDDKEIKISTRWITSSAHGVINNKATEESRSSQKSRWPVREIIESGYAVATMYYGDLEPDHHQEYRDGIRAFLHPDGKNAGFKPDDWGAIGAWAWGLSRMMDYFEIDPDIDEKKVVVVGHSRLGKTALWAGALDRRFAIVISNSSGCGGAALSRRCFGETVYHINTAFPHWFCDNFKNFNNRENELPVDQHMLISLITPRPVYVASATEDLWADPKGEFLSAKNAGVVYSLYGKKGLEVDWMPESNKSFGDYIGYHIRSGTHDITLFDWWQYMNFAERHFRK